jgi:L-malate glycosyltransferase
VKSVILTPVLLVGGTERHTQFLAQALCEAGYSVEVWCYYEHAASMVQAVEVTGAKVRLLNLARRDGLLHLYRALSRLLQEASPEIVHVEYVAPGLVPILAARLAGVKCVLATVHQPATPHGWKAKLLLRMAARLCTTFISVSQAVDMSWFGGGEIWGTGGNYDRRQHWTIYSGIDTDEIMKKAEEQGLVLRAALNLEKFPVVGVVGRLRGEKGQAVLVEAMSHLISKIPEVRLLVVGDGPDRPALEERAGALGIAGSIVWVGEVGPDEVFGYYGAMDVVAVPSRYEGFGLVAVEAMSAGKPVVASNVQGLAEIVLEDVTGLLVTAGDPDALADALFALLMNPTRALDMGRAGQLRTSCLFSKLRFSGAVISLIDQALGNA